MIEYSIQDQARILAEGELLELIHRTLRSECFEQFAGNIAGASFSRVRAAEDAAHRMTALDDVVGRIRAMGTAGNRRSDSGEA